MQSAWILALVVGLPAIVYAFMRPKGAVLADDFMPFPLILRAAGGIRQYPALLLLGAVAHSPLLLLLLDDDGIRSLLPGSIILVIYLPLLAQGAVTYGVLRPLRRARPKSAAILRHGMQGLVRALPVSLTVAMCVSLPIAAVFWLGLWAYGEGGVFVLGWTAGLVGLVMISALYLAPTVACDRGRAALGALRESMSLTHGYRLRIVGILMFFAIAHLWLIGGVASVGVTRTQDGLSTAGFLLVVYPLATLVGTWHAITAVIVYHRLRKLKYGGEVDGLVEVFE